MRFSKAATILFILFAAVGCRKEPNNDPWIKSDYTGSYKNIPYTEQLISTFTTGTYTGDQLPDDIRHLAYGRVEIDFHYNGGALTYFSPLLYYGSINKNPNDDAVEKPKFHLAVEIGHYNVIPMPVEYLFYTISTYRQPQYCRDTNCPIVTGTNYTLVIDKRPEGIILQLRQGDRINNIFPHAFFPDSSQLFFKDVTDYTESNKGDSLQEVLMIGKGFAGIEEGIHEVNGAVSQVRIFKYELSSEAPEYEFLYVRNQHAENQELTYGIKDMVQGANKALIINYEFLPYRFESGELIPNGGKQTGHSGVISNTGQLRTFQLTEQNIGLYKLNLQTINDDGSLVSTSSQPFEIWVYPWQWNFEFYEK